MNETFGRSTFMSHSKMTKRGKSLYLDSWNPNAKKYLNQCKVCGHIGYSPVIDQPDFLSDEGKLPMELSLNKVIHAQLTQTYSVLELDEFGRCSICSAILDKK